MPIAARRPLVRRALVALLASACMAGGIAHAQTTETGPRWDQLNAPQRSALRPLQGQWSQIDGERKAKWLEIANRYPTLPEQEQARISARMSAWAKMTPAERGRARLNYQELRQVPAQERQARWEAYQQLTPEQRRSFAERAAPARVPVPRAVEPVTGTKSNIVPNPADAAPRRPVAPTVVQAAPGATTSLVSRRPQPPSHQQPGLPKIAATPEFVDPATLLPQRGPQGAATGVPRGNAPGPRP